jgi:hypothetical protein
MQNQHRYQLYMRRAVMQAHLAAIDDAIFKMEQDAESNCYQNDEECFTKHWIFINGGK